MKIIAVHNSSFHADDVFACATLSILLKKKKERFKIIRTRDEKIINKADFVADVGRIYNSKKNRFDHHQKEGAGKRSNGIPYASFGLVWKKYGQEVSGSKKVAEKIDQILASPIDAGDNGVDYTKSVFEKIRPYELNSFLHAYTPTWKENINIDKIFFKVVSLAKEILSREIKKNKDLLEMEKITEMVYKNIKDKRIILVNKPFSRFDLVNFLMRYKEPFYVIYPDYKNKDWQIAAIRKRSDSYKTRKPFPKSWAGLEGIGLQKITGIKDAKFCHRDLFLTVATSKEGAIKLAQLAVNYK